MRGQGSQKRHQQQKGRRQVQEWRAELVERFPQCFKAKGEPKLPLKIGIFKDLKAALPKWGSRRLGAVLSDYTHGPTYLEGMVEGAARFGLDGKPAGAVSAVHAQDAEQRLAAIKRQMAERQAERQVRRDAETG